MHEASNVERKSPFIPLTDTRAGSFAGLPRRRDLNNLSNHVLRLQFLIDTKGLRPFFANQ